MSTRSSSFARVDLDRALRLVGVGARGAFVAVGASPVGAGGGGGGRAPAACSTGGGAVAGRSRPSTAGHQHRGGARTRRSRAGPPHAPAARSIISVKQVDRLEHDVDLGRADRGACPSARGRAGSRPCARTPRSTRCRATPALPLTVWNGRKTSLTSVMSLGRRLELQEASPRSCRDDRARRRRTCRRARDRRRTRRVRCPGRPHSRRTSVAVSNGNRAAGIVGSRRALSATLQFTRDLAERQHGVGEAGVTTRPGISHTTLVASSCTSTRPPARVISSRRSAPSWPMPVSTSASPRATVGLGDRSEQHVGGRAMRVLRRRLIEHGDDGAVAPLDGQMEIAGRDVDHARLHGWPSTASATDSGVCPLSRSARKRVNICGMCCTSRIGAGKSAGRCESTSASAAGPPVDTPIATMSAVIGVPTARSAKGRAAAGAAVVRFRWRRRTGCRARHSDLIFGTRSSRIRCCAVALPAALAGLVT